MTQLEYDMRVGLLYALVFLLMILHAVGTPATTTSYCLHPSTMQPEIVND
jgi:uncharacterized membrane protein YjdF